MKDIDGIEETMEVLKPHWAEIDADFDKHNQVFLGLAAADHDSIGRVLRAHLTVEHFVDDFLRTFYGLEDYERMRLTFYQKALLLPVRSSSATFVRPGILQLNAIRNKFGHSLNHEVANHEVSAILQVLDISRKDAKFDSNIEAIEAFAPVACAFLSLPPKHLQDLFVEAFSKVKSYFPETAAED